MAVSPSVQAPWSGVWGIGATLACWCRNLRPHLTLVRKPTMQGAQRPETLTLLRGCSHTGLWLAGPTHYRLLGPQTSDFTASWWVSRSVVPGNEPGRLVVCFLS